MGSRYKKNIPKIFLSEKNIPSKSMDIIWQLVQNSGICGGNRSIDLLTSAALH